MTPPDPATIAAGLTRGMRDMLLRFNAISSRPVLVSEWPIVAAMAVGDTQLVTTDGCRAWFLTPLGCAVRAAIASSEDAR